MAPFAAVDLRAGAPSAVVDDGANGVVARSHCGRRIAVSLHSPQRRAGSGELAIRHRRHHRPIRGPASTKGRLRRADDR